MSDRTEHLANEFASTDLTVERIDSEIERLQIVREQLHTARTELSGIHIDSIYSVTASATDDLRNDIDDIILMLHSRKQALATGDRIVYPSWRPETGEEMPSGTRMMGGNAQVYMRNHDGQITEIVVVMPWDTDVYEEVGTDDNEYVRLGTQVSANPSNGGGICTQWSDLRRTLEDGVAILDQDAGDGRVSAVVRFISPNEQLIVRDSNHGQAH